jgi:hypothetical protein
VALVVVAIDASGVLTCDPLQITTYLYPGANPVARTTLQILLADTDRKEHSLVLMLTVLPFFDVGTMKGAVLPLLLTGPQT